MFHVHPLGIPRLIEGESQQFVSALESVKVDETPKYVYSVFVEIGCEISTGSK